MGDISKYCHLYKLTQLPHNNILIFLHLFVICANRTFSVENCSSKSNRSNAGAGNSLNCGGITAGCNGGKGVSNSGVITPSGSCGVFSRPYVLSKEETR